MLKGTPVCYVDMAAPVVCARMHGLRLFDHDEDTELCRMVEC